MHQATVQELLDQEHREELIADISELVQRQLVTSSLEGHFRGRLEHLMMVCFRVMVRGWVIERN